MNLRLTIQCDIPTGLAQTVLGLAGVLPEVLLGHVLDLQPHQAVVVGRGALGYRGQELVLSGKYLFYYLELFQLWPFGV